MGNVKIKECKGFTKEEAFKDLNFDPISPMVSGNNATQAWNAIGRPDINSNKFKQFIVQQLEYKTKYVPGFGIHIVVDPPVRDIRKKPYTIINQKTVGHREFKYVYEIREDVFDVKFYKKPTFDNYNGEISEEDQEEMMEISIINPGKVVDITDNKADAIEKIKELITVTHKCYSVLPKKYQRRLL